jgi:prepilin-type N-terminal cleavage/methylation domain-containing protein
MAVPISPRQTGFTLIEAIITMVIAAVVATIGATVMSTAFRNYFLGREIVQGSAQGTLALERMTRELRTIRSPADLTAMGLSAITFVDAEGKTIAYAQSGGSLTRSENGGAAQSLADNVSALTFSYLKNDGKSAAGVPGEVWYITVAVTVTSQNTTTTYRGTVKPESF